MFEINQQVAMNRIPGTNFFYASLNLIPEAHLCYQFIKNFDEPLADPRNEQKTEGLFFSGEVSEICMPRCERFIHLDPSSQGRRGRIEQLEFTTHEEKVGGLLWRGSRILQIYLPTDYDIVNQRYPALFVHYGDRALTAGRMQNTLDNFIGRTMRPLIVVFIPPATPYEFARSQRDVYAQKLVEELVPLIDKNFRTLATPESRALMGGGEGGFGALYIALKHPGVFSKIAAQSALPIGDGKTVLLKLIKTKTKRKVQAYLDWGTYDYRIRADDLDAAAHSKMFMEAIKKAGHRVHGGQTHNGTGFVGWRLQTHKILQAFFPMTPGS